VSITARRLGRHFKEEAMGTVFAEQTTSTIQPGIYPNLPAAAYHAAPGVSSTM